MVINLQNCMQDVKQGSHPLFSLKILHEALYIVVLLFIHENSDRGVRGSYCRSSEKHSGFTRYYECQLYKIKGKSADFKQIFFSWFTRHRKRLLSCLMSSVAQGESAWRLTSTESLPHKLKTFNAKHGWVALEESDPVFWDCHPHQGLKVRISHLLQFPFWTFFVSCKSSNFMKVQR